MLFGACSGLRSFSVDSEFHLLSAVGTFGQRLAVFVFGPAKRTESVAFGGRMGRIRVAEQVGALGALELLRAAGALVALATSCTGDNDRVHNIPPDMTQS